jgi:hypothetical protein
LWDELDKVMMTRQKTGSIIAALAAIGFIGTAALHSTGYESISQLSAEVPNELQVLVPALWIAFSLDLTVLGLIVAVISWGRPPGRRLILALAALCPIGAAVLQIFFLGFIPPTGILLGVGGLALIAAGVLPRNG